MPLPERNITNTMATNKSMLLVALVVMVAAALAGSADAQRPNILATCFVKNCATCSLRNPYVCTACSGAGYRLTSAGGCNSCATNYEQNLEERTFTCTACPAGTSSPGGTGLGSQCTPITVSSGRRLFADADEALWA